MDTAALSEAEWLAWRRQGIGGSDAAAILGISPWRTARDLYDDKLGSVSAQDDSGIWVALEMGHLLEDLVARIFSKKTGYPVFQIKKMFRNPMHPCMLADVDYFVTSALSRFISALSQKRSPLLLPWVFLMTTSTNNWAFSSWPSTSSKQFHASEHSGVTRLKTRTV